MKKLYPFIKQVSPVNNVYLKYKSIEGGYFLSKADCLALIERYDHVSDEVYSDLQYIDLDINGCYEIDGPSFEIVYSDIDLTNKNHEHE